MLLFPLLLVGYYRPALLQPVRSALIDATAPLYVVTAWPGQAYDWLTGFGTMAERNSALEHENLILQRKVLRMATLMAENARLRELLNSTELLDDSVLVAELLSLSGDEHRQEMLINRGLSDGVFEGQPVLDAHGLVGSVTEVSQHTARVLLVTDTTNAVPVQINRNGVRGIAEGSGHSDEIYIRYVVASADIQQGDLVVSSGLGGRYPPGYPVGEVVRVEYNGTDPFLRVVVRPSAQLDRSTQLLVVFRPEAKVVPLANAVAAPADAAQTDASPAKADPATEAKAPAAESKDEKNPAAGKASANKAGADGGGNKKHGATRERHASKAGSGRG